MFEFIIQDLTDFEQSYDAVLTNEVRNAYNFFIWYIKGYDQHDENDRKAGMYERAA